MDLLLNLIKEVEYGCISVTANIAPKLCSEMQEFSKSKSDNELKEDAKKSIKFFNHYINLYL